MSDRIGVFPGSFDPIHNGHVDLIGRARRLFDRLYVAVLNNPNKQSFFTLEERLEMLDEILEDDPDCVAESFEGLLVEYAARRGATAIVRGLRSGADLDYELPMTLMNRRLQPEVDTLFLLPRADFADLSSSLIKEVSTLGGDVSALVPAVVAARLRDRRSD